MSSGLDMHHRCVWLAMNIKPRCRSSMMRPKPSSPFAIRWLSAIIALAFAHYPQRAASGDAGVSASSSIEVAGRRLVAAYPNFLTAAASNVLVWKDATRMAIDDGLGAKPHAAWLAAPDLEDMFEMPYPAGAPALAPALNQDPGRARNAAFFDKMYGDCRAGDVTKSLVEIVWLPKKSGQRLQVTSINGVARKLEAISRILDQLPSRFDRYLAPAAGTYNCRTIAGTERTSAHGHGIAIDIAIKHAGYWRWSKPLAGGMYAYQNEIPREIIDVFEAHGFIWGGRWYHYDTMHFEYRPELFVR